jgi:hypothetical protein
MDEGLRPDQPVEAVASRAAARLDSSLEGLHGPLLQPRFVVALVVIAAGVVWAAARGLSFYGVTPVDAVYDLDQPPVLLVLVGTWLVYRSRRR